MIMTTDDTVIAGLGTKQPSGDHDRPRHSSQWQRRSGGSLSIEATSSQSSSNTNFQSILHLKVQFPPQLRPNLRLNEECIENHFHLSGSLPGTPSAYLKLILAAIDPGKQRANRSFEGRIRSRQSGSQVKSSQLQGGTMRQLPITISGNY